MKSNKSSFNTSRSSSRKLCENKNYLKNWSFEKLTTGVFDWYSHLEDSLDKQD